MILNHTEFAIKHKAADIAIPSDPKARLMYYFKTVCSLLSIDEDGKLSFLTNYHKYYLLSDVETALLVDLATTLNPKILLNKCIFIEPDLCKDSDHEFLEL